jgi:hypothetical protein
VALEAANQSILNTGVAALETDNQALLNTGIAALDVIDKLSDPDRSQVQLTGVNWVIPAGQLIYLDRL